METFCCLTNIIDEIIPDDCLFFNEEDSLELYETCLYIMEEFIINNPTVITEPDFDDIFDENIKELLEVSFINDICYTDETEEELDEIIEQAKTDFFKDFIPVRSYPDTIILKEPNYIFVKEQINLLKNKPQPVQRTKEWYEFRQNLITASNAYKAFESQSAKNQLIYEKCQPTQEDTIDPNIKVIQMVNVNTTLHHGQKYEPLSVMIYEDTYNTKVDDFGCIQHEKYSFLGASPDGINVDPKSLRYGRMLEIKNIVNREIDGIPKKEYWIQMQLQMEVCNLDECDFLETKFTEYNDEEAFLNDTTNKRKGVIMYFHTKEGKPFYKYMPFTLVSFKDINEWQEQMVDLYQSDEHNYVWIKNYYWKLDIVSCVLVCRNKQWFKDNINELADLWATIIKERASGFEHRAPNRKPKQVDGFAAISNSNKCLLNFNKETGKITVIKSEAPESISNLNIDHFFNI
jgi:putative phage-type endonuclease